MELEPARPGRDDASAAREGRVTDSSAAREGRVTGSSDGDPASDASPATSDVVADNLARLRALFPAVVTEGSDGAAVNVDVLRQLVGDRLLGDADERFGLEWPGKRRARAAALEPPAGTLRAVSEPPADPSLDPCDARAGGADADGSESLLIEGDNLDALKLLRASLGGRVKIIYLDPPYNTGRELVYEDDFRRPRAPAVGPRSSGPVDRDDAGAGASRLHAAWLDMMYPRLWLARDLLRRDGVLFVSIDDGELPNLLALCREIFGEDNHVATFVWEKKRKASNLDRQVRSIAEYVVCFRREQPVALIAPEDKVERDKPYPFYNTGNRRTVLRFPGGHVRTTLPDGAYAAGRYDDRRTHVVLLDDVTVRDGVVVGDFRLEGEWRYAQESVDRLIAARQRIELRGRRFKPYFINDAERAKLVRTLWTRGTYDVGTNEDGNAEIAELFGDDVFSFPKPTSLIVKLCQIVGDRDALVLDFFAGSGTTGHAVMALNAADGGRRRFVLVQSPEPLDPAIKAQSAAVAFCDAHGLPRTIAALTRERLRRASAAVRRAHPQHAEALRFRTLAIEPPGAVSRSR